MEVRAFVWILFFQSVDYVDINEWGASTARHSKET